MKLTIIRLENFSDQDRIDLQKIWPEYSPSSLQVDDNYRIYAARFNERLLAAVGDEHVVALKAEHEAHEEARNRNDEKRVVADEVDLLNDVAEPCAAQPHQKRPREDPESADPAEESDHEAADCREELSHLSSPPKQASMLLAG